MALKGQTGLLNPLFGRKRPPFTNEHRANIAKAAKGRSAGSKNYFWKGGIKHNNGYIKIHMPDHPHCDAAGYIYEHRLVMENTLGRLLLPNERPHHINGNRQDNRPNNLVLYEGNGKHMLENHVNRDAKGRFISKNTGHLIDGKEYRELPWEIKD